MGWTLFSLFNGEIWVGHCYIWCSCHVAVPSHPQHSHSASVCTSKQGSIANTASYSQFQLSWSKVSAGDYFSFETDIRYFIFCQWMDTCAIIPTYPVTLFLLSLPLTCQFNKELHGQIWWGLGTNCAGKAIKRHRNIKIDCHHLISTKRSFSFIGGPLKCRLLMKMQLQHKDNFWNMN